MHNNATNTYTFVYNGRKIRLWPMRDKSFVKPMYKKENIHAPNNKQSGIESREHTVAFPLEDIYPKHQILRIEVPHTLSELQILIPMELKKELPPIQDIQHTVDSIPGASFPKLSAC